jgi:hypothetical protein
MYALRQHLHTPLPPLQQANAHYYYLLLLECARQPTGDNRADTTALAQRANALQSRVSAATRRMMAAVSELSMYQATALRLQKEKSRRENAVIDGRNRLARSEPPSEDAEVIH